MFRTAWNVFGIVFMTAFYAALICLSVICLVGGSYVVGAVVGASALAHLLLYRRNRRLEHMRDPGGAVGLSALPLAPVVAKAETLPTPNIPLAEGPLCPDESVPSTAASNGSPENWHVYGYGSTYGAMVDPCADPSEATRHHETHVPGSDWRND